jgi:hypothetical protein
MGMLMALLIAACASHAAIAVLPAQIKKESTSAAKHSPSHLIGLMETGPGWLQ